MPRFMVFSAVSDWRVHVLVRMSVRVRVRLRVLIYMRVPVHVRAFVHGLNGSCLSGRVRGKVG